MLAVGCPPVYAEDSTGLVQLERALARRGPAARLRWARRFINSEHLDAQALDRWLHRDTGVPAANYRRLLRSIGLHVPDAHGRFGRVPKQRLDWLNALLDAKAPQPLSLALRQARLTIVLMRAIAKQGDPESATSLLRFAFRHQGAFRDECGRLLRAMGDVAVPALVRAGQIEPRVAYKISRYADYQLDRMNRLRPGLALRSATVGLRAELLHAYGEMRLPAAVFGVVDHIGDRDHRIRRAARWALFRYLHADNAPLTRADGTKRGSPLGLREITRRAIVRRLNLLSTNKRQAKDGVVVEEAAEDLAHRLFAALDRKRLAQSRRLLAGVTGSIQAGRYNKAERELEQVLATDEEHPDHGKIAARYRELGKRALFAKRYRLAERAFLSARLVGGGVQLPESVEARLAAIMVDQGRGLDAAPRLAALAAMHSRSKALSRVYGNLLEQRRSALWRATLLLVLAGLLGVVLGWRARRRRVSTSPRSRLPPGKRIAVR